jgi:general secretion pathway protein I
LSRKAPSERGDAGFTLIEVVIALAVVAMSLVAIASLVATTVRGTRAIDQHLALIATARSIETAMPGRDQLALGSASGSVADHRWRLDVVPYVARNVDPRLPNPWISQAVVLRVQSPSGSMIEIDTVRLRRRPTQ